MQPAVKLYHEERKLSPTMTTLATVTEFGLPSDHLAARVTDLSAKTFYARFAIDRVNREGIPRSSELRFDTIHDLDYLCESLGGSKVSQFRKPFSIFDGTFSEQAVTLYSFGDGVYVVNKTDGYHPNRRTTVLTAESREDAAAPIIARFTKYFGSNPVVIGPEIQQSRKGAERKTIVRLDG